MTRKDYIAIANALHNALVEVDVLGDTYKWGVMTSASLIANAMQDDNPRFSKDLFMDAVRTGQ